MGAVPERDAVDRCFKAAHDFIGDTHSEDPTGAAVLAGARGIVYALEGLMHQVRDADDTVATVLVPEIKQGLADLVIQTNATAGAVADAVAEAARKR